MSLRVENFIGNYQTSLQSTSKNRQNQDPVFNAQESELISKRAKASFERYKAIQNKSLIYHKEQVRDQYLFYFFKVGTKIDPAYYEYTANGKEFIIQIRNKFGVKEGAIWNYDTPDADACKPTAGTKIRFYEYDLE